MLAALIVPLVAVALVLPLLYVAVTWEHDLVQSYAALPAPADLGTKEFRWRCFLSALTRHGWRGAILRSPCPRITLQCPFALVSADFAQLTTSLGVPELALDRLPLVFPQVAVSSLFLQLLGNSNFPASVRNLRIKALTICQLRPLDMRFHDANGSADNPSALHCLMVLTEKRFLEDEIEFAVQTDLFDDQGTLWQSVTWLSVPFHQETLLVPLSTPGGQLDAALLERAAAEPKTASFACSQRNLAEFEQVGVADLTGGSKSANATPLLWVLGQAMAVLEKQERVPALPLMLSATFGDEVPRVPLEKKLAMTSWTSGEQDKPVTKFAVELDESGVALGLLRTVGWTYKQEDKAEDTQ